MRKKWFRLIHVVFNQKGRKKMRKNEKKLITILLMAALVVVFATPTVFAGPPIKKAPSKAITDMRARDLKLTSDISVSYIEYFNCPCDIAMDVYYVDSYLSVKIFNESTLKPTVKITVKYFDIPSNRVKTISKNHTFTGRGGKKVIMNHGPLLIKKSYGVRAEITMVGSTITDPKPANNKLTQLLCGQVPE